MGGMGCGVVVWDMMWSGGVRRGCQVGPKFRQGGKILNFEIPSKFGKEIKKRNFHSIYDYSVILRDTEDLKYVLESLSYSLNL